MRSSNLGVSKAGASDTNPGGQEYLDVDGGSGLVSLMDGSEAGLR